MRDPINEFGFGFGLFLGLKGNDRTAVASKPSNMAVIAVTLIFFNRSHEFHQGSII